MFTAARDFRHRRRHLVRVPGCDAAAAADLRDHLEMPACVPQPVRHRKYHPHD